MTLDYPVPFHTPNLVWDSTIAIYLFLLGISSGAVQLAIAYKRSHKLENPSKNWIIRAAAVLGSVPTLIGLTLLIFHLARPWTFWKLMFNYQFNSVMSMGVMIIPSLYADSWYVGVRLSSKKISWRSFNVLCQNLASSVKLSMY